MPSGVSSEEFPVAVSCSVLQGVAVCCSVFQGVAVCFCVLPSVAERCSYSSIESICKVA